MLNLPDFTREVSSLLFTNRRASAPSPRKALVPLPCPHRRGGCPAAFVDINDRTYHLRSCKFRTVMCDACGKGVVAKELMTHRRSSRCAENQLKGEVIRSSRMLKGEVASHAQRWKREKMELERHERQQLKQSVHCRVGWMPRVPSAFPSPDSPPRTIRPWTTTSSDPRDSPSPSPPALLHRHCSSNFPELTQSYVTSAEYSAPCPTSLLRPVPSQCSRCCKYFWSSTNNAKACRWHKGVRLSFLL